MSRVHIIGAGLAGSEAAYFLASKGHQVVLHEMRPERKTEAHKTGGFGELVCSNSLKSKSPSSAPGILKSEMTELGSLVLKAAEKACIPGGEALVVDREVFSKEITETLRSHPKIEIRNEALEKPVAGEVTLIATGPLTTTGLVDWIRYQTDENDLYFYDAIAPIIDATSIDLSKTFLANRYDKGEDAAYLNCPLTKEEYYEFVEALNSGEKVPPQPFEKEKLFHACQPIESIAASGMDSLRFGPMKPIGLRDQDGRTFFSVVQLRPENEDLAAYNLVGFQTKLKYGEQKRIFRMIPALRNAEFFRLGSIHRNTFVCGPRILRPDLSLKGNPLVYLAGQITGVEGYVESAACGLLAALFIDQRLNGIDHRPPPLNTAMGALLHYVTASDPKNFQPTNIHFGIFHTSLYENLEPKTKSESRSEARNRTREQIASQSLEEFRRFHSTGLKTSPQTRSDREWQQDPLRKA